MKLLLLKCKCLLTYKLLQILHFFKVLSSSYESVVNSEEFEILRSLLETDFPYKVKLAGDYLMNSSLSAAEVRYNFLGII